MGVDKNQHTISYKLVTGHAVASISESTERTATLSWTSGALATLPLMFVFVTGFQFTYLSVVARSRLWKYKVTERKEITRAMSSRNKVFLIRLSWSFGIRFILLVRQSMYFFYWSFTRPISHGEASLTSIACIFRMCLSDMRPEMPVRKSPKELVNCWSKSVLRITRS